MGHQLWAIGSRNESENMNERIGFLIVKSLNILDEMIFFLGSVKNLVFRDEYL